MFIILLNGVINMSKKNKESKIKELESKYKGALSEYILKWNSAMDSNQIIQSFWLLNEPEDVEKALIELGDLA